MSKFIRCDEGERSLKVAVKTYDDDKGNEISLVSCVHVAESEFFKTIKSYADSKEKVLYEGVGGKDGFKANGNTWLGDMFNDAMAWCMNMYTNGLKYQPKEIDYAHLGDNWEPCDVSAQEFRSNALSTEQLSKFFGSMFSPDMRKKGEEMKGMKFSNNREMIVKMITGIEELPMADLYVAKGRSEVVNKRLKEIFETGDLKSVAVFYGATHMDGIEEYVTKELGFKPKEESWIEAFRY